MNLKTFYVRPHIPKELQPLYDMAFNIWSTWDKEADRLMRRIDPLLYREVQHNPVAMLNKLPADKLKELSRDKGFLYELDKVWQKFSKYMEFEGVYTADDGKELPLAKEDHIAYFSMEFGLHESVPIYSGGLGILAGDHLKAASDMGIPLFGFGLLYKYGYLTQRINMDGFQEEEYIENMWYLKPVREEKNAKGEPLIFTMKLKGEEIGVKIWRIDVGKIPLYLLDTNIPQNTDYQKSITDHLYVADRRKRIEQEILLGQGAIIALPLLKLEPKVYHLNEGHSAFLIIERLKNYMIKEKMPFEKARQMVRQTTVFTTHTPVIEGNEHYDEALIKEYLAGDITELGIPPETLINLGKIDDSKNFWLPALAIRFSKYSNGVSKLHGEVSRQMWKEIYPNLHINEVPIDSVTNGVHLLSWLSMEMTYLFDRYVGPDYVHKAGDPDVWEKVLEIPDNEIWEAHKRRKEQLITFIRERMVLVLQKKGAPMKQIKRVSTILNPDYLTIGFARRFAPYKRANLLLTDAERLKAILTNPQKPVQIIFAGKAHPADVMGKSLIKEVIDFAKNNNLEDRVVFVEDYDINVARHLVQGVDMWLNTPIKPMEASGTSGMKAGMNGILNLSVLDGWWPECYDGENGWAITAGDLYENYDMKRSAEAMQIYDLLDEEITELYYDKGNSYFPVNWVKRMKQSMFTVGKNFNMHRMLRDYFYKFYLPIGINLYLLEEKNYEMLDEVVAMDEKLKKFWSKIYIKDVFTDFDKKDIQAEDTITVEAYVFLDNAEKDLIDAEMLYIFDDELRKVQPLEFVERFNDNVAKFVGKLTLQGSGIQGFNIRIRPKSKFFFETYPEYVKWYIN